MSTLGSTWTQRRMDEDRQEEQLVEYVCSCGHKFREDDAIVHFGNVMNHMADMDACPKCESEDLEEV